MMLDERRELLRMFIERVTVNRAKRGACAFESDRVKIKSQTM